MLPLAAEALTNIHVCVHVSPYDGDPWSAALSSLFPFPRQAKGRPVSQGNKWRQLQPSSHASSQLSTFCSPAQYS